MKITPKQYAQALLEKSIGKNQSETDVLVKDFFNFLVKNRQLKNIEKIMSVFTKLYNEKEKLIDVEVVSREKLGDKEKEEINNFLEKRYIGKKIIIKEFVDEKIMGGLIIRAGDEIVDASLFSQLQNLKNFLEK